MPLENYIEKVNQLINEADVCGLIAEIVEHPQIFVFGQLFELKSIQSLKESSSKWFNLLELFAYGKLSDYNDQTMPPLNDQQIKKLRLLTIVTLATSKSKKIPYSVLIEELKVNNLRDLEDLIIEAIYSNLIKGKLDQSNSCIEIESTMARDVRADKLDGIVDVLSNWISNCENILTNIDKQTKAANLVKLENKTKKFELDNYIANVKKTIKVTQEMDDVVSWEVNSMQHHEFEKSKRGPYKQSRFGLKSRNRF